MQSLALLVHFQQEKLVGVWVRFRFKVSNCFKMGNIISRPVDSVDGILSQSLPKTSSPPKSTLPAAPDAQLQDTGTAPRASTCLVSLTSLLSAWVSGADSSIGEFISNEFQHHDSKPVRKSLQVSPLIFRPTLAAELAAVLSHLNVAFEPQENLQPCGGQEHPKCPKSHVL